MARPPREYSGSGFYHIMFRGINHQSIFLAPKDYRYMLGTIAQVKAATTFSLHAYCMMTNHVHLLLKEAQWGDISIIMKKMLTKYSMYFNRTYERCGALFDNRYKSRAVEEDSYFVMLLLYIHQNPVRAGLAQHAYEYRYSSYHEYAAASFALVDPEPAATLIDAGHWQAMHEETIDRSECAFVEKPGWTDAAVSQRLLALAGVENATDLACLDKKRRNGILAELKTEGVSVRQIGRVTGLSRGLVAKSST